VREGREFPASRKERQGEVRGAQLCKTGKAGTASVGMMLALGNLKTGPAPLQFMTLLTWRLLPAGKSRWPPWTGNCAQPPRTRGFSCWVREGRELPTSRKEREKWGTRRYNRVNPADGLYGDADDPLEIPAL
jgi:hypothetical protein